MERLWRDRRGVTVQIGAILLFGILVLALATYQAVVVPIENERVEFNHNQQVQSDMLELRSALLQTSAGDRGQSVSVSLGTTYPSRVLLVNPPPASGSLRTDAAERINLTNVEATNAETRDYLAGNYSVERRPLTYDPSYNVYDAAPSTSIEGSIVVNSGPSGESVAISGQSLVSDKTVTLVVVRGNLSRGRSGSVTVDPTSPDRTLETAVRNKTDAPINLTVSTSLSAERWRDLVAEEAAVRNVTATGSDDTVRIRLEPIPDGESPYTLRVAVVEVGSGTPDPAPRYVTSPQAPDESLAPGDDVVFEVRDHYNNPADGSITVTDGASLVVDDDDGTPDTYEPADREDGQYRLRYLGGDGAVKVSLSGVTGAPGAANVIVTEITAGDPDEEPATDGDGDAASLAADEVAFDDVNGDGVYQSLERAYTAADLDDDGNDVDVQGTDIVVEKSFEVSKLDIQPDSFVARNVSIESNSSEIKINTKIGPVTARDVTIDSATKVTIKSGTGSVNLQGSTIRGADTKKIKITSSVGTNLRSATLSGRKITLKVGSGGNIDIRDARLESKNKAKAEPTGGTLIFNEAAGGDPGTRIVKLDNNNPQDLSLEAGSIDGSSTGPEKGTVKDNT